MCGEGEVFSSSLDGDSLLLVLGDGDDDVELSLSARGEAV